MDTIYAWIVSLFAVVWPFADSGEDHTRFFGYVEGEYVYVAAQSSGILQTLDVNRGDTVGINEYLFSLDDDKQLIALTKSKMSLAIAGAQLADESTGKRPAELTVIEQ